MQGRARKLMGILLVLSLSCLLQAQQEIIPLDRVKPGMVGYGLTVFRGNSIERFQVEVIDIWDDTSGNPIILVRCTSSYGCFDIERSGLIAGMSGSPIYFEGKLAGALSMGWIFAKETLAGVTPIETMLKIARRPMENKLAFAPETGRQQGVGGLIPLKTPLMVSGVMPGTFGKIEEEFGRYGWVPVYGGIGRGKALNKEEYKLVPGAAMGVRLIGGDIDFTGIGTVTWVEGNEVLAFGHSFFNAGEFIIPITTAHICTIMESDVISFKLGYPIEEAGMLLQDRLAGVYGKTGTECPMIPMAVRIKNKATGVEQVFNVEVMKHSVLTPVLCSIAMSEFLDRQEATLGENTTWVGTRVYVKGEKPLEWSNMYVDRGRLRGDFTGPLRYLYDNRFKVMDVEKIEVEVEVMHKLREARISYLRVPACDVNQGENLLIELTLLPCYENPVSLPITLKIPADAIPGEYTISVTGGQDRAPNIFPPENLEQYMNALRKANQYKSNQVVLSMPLPKIQVCCNGAEMSDLPPSVIGNLLPANHTKNISVLSEIYVVVQDTPYAISGSANLIIYVKENKEKQQ